MIGLLEHLHVVQYGILLTESARADFLVKTYGARLLAKWDATGKDEPGAIQQMIANEPGADFGVKLVNFILSSDPSRAQSYAQWMVNRYLKNAIRLEDLERAASYLSVFDAAKSRIRPADINAYKTLPDLFAAVRPFIEQGEAVSNRQEMDRETRRMHQEDQAKVLFDTPEMKIVVPLTEQAAIFFGRNTQWCTAATGSRNYFDSYNERGRLYIILDKASNRRWQWHFEDEMFMDENDHTMANPTFVQFVQKHPHVIKAIGEDKFLPWAVQIGIDRFSPEAIKRIGRADIVKKVNSLAAYRSLPKEMRADPLLADEIIDHDIKAIGWLPPNLVSDEKLLELAQRHSQFIYNVPKKRLTQAMVHAALPRLNASAINNFVPEQLRDTAVKKQFYAMASNDRYVNIKLDQVPEEYRTTEVCLNFCKKEGEISAMKKALGEVPKELLTTEFALSLFYHRREWVNVIPTTLMTPEFVEIAFDVLQKNGANPDSYSFLTRVHLNADTPKKIIMYMVGQRDVKLSSVPKEFLSDPEVVIKYLETTKYNDKAQRVPAEYLNDDIVATTLSDSAIKKFPPEVLTPEAVDRAMSNNHYGNQRIADTLPKQTKTEKMIAILVKHGCVPVKSIPASLKTPETVIGRIAKGDGFGRTSYSTKTHYDEIRQVPKAMMTPEFAEALVHASPPALEHIPDHLITEPSVHHAMDRQSGYSYHRNETQTATFSQKLNALPKEKWTPRVMIRAIQHHVIPAEMSVIPQHAMTPDVAAEIIHYNVEQYHQAPVAFRRDEDFRVLAAQKKADVLDIMTPEEITPKVNCAAVASWAANRYAREHLEKLDRTQWDEATWDKAVGYIATLDDVPTKWRTPELTAKAIKRDPANVAFLPDPAGYMKQHGIEIPSDDKRLRQSLEDNGIVFQGKKMTNVRDLPGEKLPLGSATPLKQGPTNMRLYVFDKDGKLAARLGTQNGTIKILSDSREARKYKELVCQAASKFLANYEIGELDGIEIYKKRLKYGQERPEEMYYTDSEAERVEVDGLTWSEAEKPEGTSYVLWDGNDQKMQVVTDKPSTGWGNSSRGRRIEGISISDEPWCTERAASIFRYLEKNVSEPGYAHSLEHIGILADTKGKRHLIRSRQIAKLDNLTIWMSEEGNRVGLFDESGMIAYALLRKSGAVDNVKRVYRWNPEGHEVYDENAINSLMAKVATVLHNRGSKPAPSISQAVTNHTSDSVSRLKGPPQQLDLFGDN